MSINELENASKYTRYINTAFQNANIVDKVPTSQEVNLKDYEPEMILAFNNLKTIAGDQLANTIVDSIKGDLNKLGYLNKYFNQFKNTLPNQRILSIGDFTTRFDKFYTQNVGQTSLPEVTRVRDINISDLSQNNLQKLSTIELDQLFRDIYKQVNAIDEITDGMPMEFNKTTETKLEKKETTIKNSKGIFISFAGYKDKKRVNDVKISYILGQSRAVYNPKSINWDASNESNQSTEGSGIVFPRSKVLKKRLVHFR